MKYKESIEMLIIVEHDDHYDYHDHGEEEEWESPEQQLLLVVAEHRKPSPPSQGWHDAGGKCHGRLDDDHNEGGDDILGTTLPQT